MKCANCGGELQIVTREHYHYTGKFINTYCSECVDLRVNDMRVNYWDHKSSPLWTCLFSRCDGRCFHVDWGQADGPQISERTAVALMFQYLKSHPSLCTITCVRRGTARDYAW